MADVIKVLHQHCPSLDDLLSHLETSCVGGTWQQLVPWQERADNDAHRFCGRALGQMIRDCRSMAPFQDAIAKVQSLTEDLSMSLPPLPTIRRQRVTAAQGAHLKINRVLQGDLAHAWTSMARVPALDHTPMLTVFLDVSYLGSTNTSVIFWTLAATLALVQLLEESGRRVGVIGWDSSETCLGARLPGTPYVSHAFTCMLKDFSAPWDIAGMVCTTDKAFLRRLYFRLAEMCPAGVHNAGYGNVPSTRWKAQCAQQLAQTYGWPHALLGPECHNNGINSQETARAWLAQECLKLQGPNN